MTVEDALKHPTWDMGAKITIDSSTLMNKGLEVIEAHELFGVDYDEIEVVVHPQSVIHSMVEFSDGATIAQLSMPDMRLPIGLALGAPDRLDEPFGAIDWTTLQTLTFEPSRPGGVPVPGAGLRGGSPGRRCPGHPRARPTRSRSRRSSTAGSRGWRSPRSTKKFSNPGLGTSDSVADVLEADRVARERARTIVDRIARQHPERLGRGVS